MTALESRPRWTLTIGKDRTAWRVTISCGRRRRRWYCGATTANEARACSRVLQRALDGDAGLDPLTMDLTPWRIVETLRTETAPDESASTLRDVWDRYLRSLDLTAYTAAGHYAAIAAMLARVEDGGGLVDDRILAGYSRWTWHHRRASIAKALDFGGHSDAARHWRSLRCPRQAKRRSDPDPLSVGEALSLYGGTEALYRPALLTLLDTACRVGELLGIRWCDVNFEAGTVTIAGALVRRRTGKVPHRSKWSTDGKTRDPRVVPLTSGLTAALRGVPKGRGRLVFGASMTAATLRAAVKRAYKAAGIRPRKLSATRHSRLSWVAKSDGLLAAAKLAGHADLQMVIRHYARETEEVNINGLLD